MNTNYVFIVYDAEIVNEFLKKIINEKKYPFEFDYRIDNDEKWKLADWHLQSVR
ncbi:hypothetical protein [Flavobacterium chryseum]|uniref:hypothetical protein n=1 Tax=Flavobacterium sp. P3160 TaxID=2512113 RepID=UPI001414E4B3|nr:hypothetical protein [Flavobacterium sp. P3160]